MDINERVKIVRKTLKMSQEKFAETINISRSNLGNIETSKVNVTGRLIADICERHNVCEEWLRNGEGEMFHTPTLDDYPEMKERIMSEQDPVRRKLLKSIAETIIELPIEVGETLLDLAKRIAANEDIPKDTVNSQNSTKKEDTE